MKEIASVRLIPCCCPTPANVERMNNMHKLVHTKSRSALKHARVAKLLFCYVNICACLTTSMWISAWWKICPDVRARLRRS